MSPTKKYPSAAIKTNVDLEHRLQTTIKNVGSLIDSNNKKRKCRSTPTKKTPKNQKNKYENIKCDTQRRKELIYLELILQNLVFFGEPKT